MIHSIRDGFDANGSERCDERDDGIELQLHDGRVEFEPGSHGGVPVRLERSRDGSVVVGRLDTGEELVCGGHVRGSGAVALRDAPDGGLGVVRDAVGEHHGGSGAEYCTNSYSDRIFRNISVRPASSKGCGWDC